MEAGGTNNEYYRGSMVMEIEDQLYKRGSIMKDKDDQYYRKGSAKIDTDDQYTRRGSTRIRSTSQVAAQESRQGESEKNKTGSVFPGGRAAEAEKTKFALGLDEILPHVGAFGRYQKVMMVLVSLLYIPVAMHPFLMYFATIVPSWKCLTNSTICLLNGTLSSDDMRRCDLPRSEWIFTEGKLFSVATQFDLSCDELWIMSLITFMYFAGWAVGAIVIGQVADTYGRKSALLPSVIITLATTVLNPFMPYIYLTVVCSFVLGFCYPGVETQASILLSELVGTKKRPLAARVSTTMFPVTWMLLALKAYLLKDWRILSLVCSLPYIFTIGICFLVPESIRWLQFNGKSDRVLEVLTKIGKFNNNELSPRIVVAENTKVQRGTLKDIFGTREFALQSLALQGIWCFTLLCYYGLIIASPDLEGNVYKDFALVSVMELPGILLAVIACQKIGRKASTLAFLAFGGVACLVIPWIPRGGYGSVIRLVLGIVGRLAIGINYNALIVWTTELYPTKFRSTAMGVMHATARVGAASSPWIVTGLKPLAAWLPFTFMGASALIGALGGIRLRETKGEDLVETGVEEVPRKVERKVARPSEFVGVDGPYKSEGDDIV